MNANDLRIGNWVQFRHTETPVRITLGDFVREYNDEHLEDYEPIPLTEEWLLKFGFKSDVVSSVFGFKWVSINMTQDGDFWVENITGELVEIDFVHQLQNLIFALTGEELQTDEINQKVN
jgi:hypothetical protein